MPAALARVERAEGFSMQLRVAAVRVVEVETVGVVVVDDERSTASDDVGGLSPYLDDMAWLERPGGD